ncbi:MAG TPA: sigma-70 family RNA polymerase sigma factor, partial [Candidatus Cloacimonadota bacterium]|nr:sigma-70 family RNA polymerase sigma factor [Candidatus Cloacimonadota bacterium]
RGQRIETTSFDEILQTGDYQDYSTKDLFEDKELVDPQKLYYKERINERLHSAIDKLDDREADIIRTYYGLNESHETKNFAQIAEVMGLSRERVRQIQKEALKKIMNELRPEEDAFVDDFIDRFNY